MNKKLDILKVRSAKLLIVLLCFVMVFSGCGSTPSEEPSEAPAIGSENPVSDSGEGEAPLRGSEYWPSGPIEIIKCPKCNKELENWVTSCAYCGTNIYYTWKHLDKVIDYYVQNVYPKLFRNFDPTLSCDDSTVFDLEYGYKISDFSGGFSPSVTITQYSPSSRSYEITTFSSKNETAKKSFYVPPFFGGTAKNSSEYSVTGEIEIRESDSDHPVFIFRNTVRVDIDAMYDAGHNQITHYHQFEHRISYLGNEAVGYIAKIEANDIGGWSETDDSGWSTFSTFGAMDDLLEPFGNIPNDLAKIVEGALPLDHKEFAALAYD